MPMSQRSFVELSRTDTDTPLRMAIYDRPGRGVPILCLPGLTRNHRDFDGILALFPARPVIRVDLCGRGDSDWDPDPSRYTPQTYLADLIRWLESRPEPRFDVIGTSLGGILAMGLAAAVPARLRRLVINDIGPVIEPAGMDAIRSRVGMGGPFTDWNDACAAVRAGKLADHPREDDWMRFTRAVCTERAGQVVFDYDPAIGQQAKGADVPPFWEAWEPTFAFPVLVLRGACSDLFSQATCDRMCTLHPNAEAVLVPDTGHAPTLYEPECQSALTEFLGASR